MRAAAIAAWFHERYGLSVQFRDHARLGSLRTYHDIQFLIGLSVR